MGGHLLNQRTVRLPQDARLLRTNVIANQSQAGFSYLFRFHGPSTLLLCVLEEMGVYLWNKLRLDSSSVPFEGLVLPLFRLFGVLGRMLLGKLSSESESEPDTTARF